VGDLLWSRKGLFTFPLAALRHHAVCLGASGSGKTETLYRCAFGAYKIYRQQVIFLDAKGESKRAEEKESDNAARFVATMRAAGARSIRVFPATYYNGWQGTPTELQNRLLAVIDFSESQYYGDVAANAVYLALHTPETPRSSDHFLANLRPDRLKSIYEDDPRLYERVLRLDKHLLAQVRMRYEVFFNAMHGQLDGDLAYEDADAVYLRVRGFTLRQEAPRLGRFLVYDFMHYIAERRRQGIKTLFIIDEFNALRMREETSVLFEQVRSFGGCIIIAAQGYAGLGPSEYADRILDATNTYILHSCSDPSRVSKRAGKRFRLESSWTDQDDEDHSARRHIRPHWDWKVPDNAVMQQQEGQAFWINRGCAQQAQTVRVPINRQLIAEAWEDIRQQEEAQLAKNQNARHAAITPPQKSSSTLPDASNPASLSPSKSNKVQPSRTSEKQSPKLYQQKTTKKQTENVSSTRKGPEASTSTSFPVSPAPQMPQSDIPPTVSRDDDGPDYL
jgi:Type IV secretion-system coupling protein DNA-binding domain